MKTVYLTDTRVYRDIDGGRVPSARYVWRGPSDHPVFRYENCRELVCDDVDIVCESPTTAVFHAERTRVGAGVHPSTMHQWRNVRVYGNGAAVCGFLFDGIDQNNEHMRFDCVSVYGCRTGWRFAGQQAKEALLTQCRFESGIVALWSDSGFQWIGGTIAVCDTGIILARPGDPVLLQGVAFETCKRMLLTAEASTDAQPITLASCRFAADQLHEDGGMIVLRHAGPLTILGGSYGDGDQRIPQIHLAGIGEQAVNIIGAKFGSFGANAVTPIRCSPGVRETVGYGTNAYQRGADADERTATMLIPQI